MLDTEFNADQFFKDNAHKLSAGKNCQIGNNLQCSDDKDRLKFFAWLRTLPPFETYRILGKGETENISHGMIVKSIKSTKIYLWTEENGLPMSVAFHPYLVMKELARTPQNALICNQLNLMLKSMMALPYDKNRHDYDLRKKMIYDFLFYSIRPNQDYTTARKSRQKLRQDKILKLHKQIEMNSLKQYWQKEVPLELRGGHTPP